MAEYEKNLSIDACGERNTIRMSVVKYFSNEVAGKGKDKLASRYTYYVETLANGDRIFLRRPAHLHYGFDFVVCIENYNFNPNGRKRNCPSHTDIIEDLKLKSSENKKNYKKLLSVLERVYNCEYVSDTDMDIKFKNGFSSEMIIKTLKWLFIEQDIRYWNYSGRDMLWKAICEV